ncbi:MAG: hypothetical protein R3E95_16065 [Thiolinea sp.]
MQDSDHDSRSDWLTHSSHWGSFSARQTPQGLELRPFAREPAPTALLDNIPTALRHPELAWANP